jgi:hypothetical protein
MIRWDIALEREFVEQRTLVNLPLAHHRLHSSFDAGSASMRRLPASKEFFNRINPKADMGAHCELGPLASSQPSSPAPQFGR